MDRAKTRQLLVDHYLDFYTLACNMLNDDDDARDAVQEALARTMARQRLDDPLSYCYTVLRHIAIDTLRHRKLIAPLADDVADELPSHDNDDSYHALLEQVMQLRNRLPKATRALVILHDEKGLSYRELARLTRKSTKTIHKKVEEAHRAMKQELTRKKEEK